MFVALKKAYAKWKLERKLAAYVATLSPEKQKAANELRRKLQASSPEQGKQILLNEVARITQQQMKLKERLERMDRN